MKKTASKDKTMKRLLTSTHAMCATDALDKPAMFSDTDGKYTQMRQPYLRADAGMDLTACAN
jgi:hypothetical protein